RSRQTTDAPREASRVAVASPIPDAPPVTMALMPSNSDISAPSARSDHALARGAQLGDPQLHDIPRLQPDLRLLAHPDPGRGAGGDQVARLEHHELPQVVDDEERVEYHRLGVAGLPACPVDVEPHVEVVDVRDLVRGGQPGPGRVERLGRLALRPLPA